MAKLKDFLFKLFRSMIDQTIKELLDAVTVELNEEIDEAFTEETQREALKQGIDMLRSRVSVAIRERL